ncbi:MULTISPECIES: response regulator [unclassified Kosakonia]|uniref:response regulator n=1 Tax=unclassified Kosakonia TaxID=2632876 RepID=UPI0031B690D5
MLKPKKVLIADDHPIYLMGMRTLLAPLSAQYLIIDEARTADEVVAKLEQHATDILITDLSMPGERYNDGLALIQLLKRRWPDLLIIVVSMINNPGIQHSLLRLGVHRVLNKASLSTKLLQTLQALTSPAISPKTNAPQVDVVAQLEVRLTPKENEVLRLLLRGMTVNDISTRLNRTKQTVSAQKKSAMRKLGVTSEYELYQYLQHIGLTS